ncbi:RNA polymerase sigma factor [Dinghuibacter silviterrae]|uniref:RNA polymerase sigma-70 factor (ECF subfamily) n=1 Tax=Dinghuibacter silviterrae TaxID=1539049 RepID=A0A4V3GKJ4_9BACT|nr:RNA polymerase sigma factor [Dinghuibacter silviterrae]TDW95892.1 RNA polymerase sigma-70 factor (ECF subfamily) [Dinghuibacter silviterrae]
MEDKELVIGLQQGDRSAFDALYYRYYPGVYRNICKLIHKYEIAEDILQEVFLALWDNRSSIDPSRPVAGWLFVVSYNKSLKWLKADIREHHLYRNYLAMGSYDDAPEPEEDNFRAQMDLLNSVIEELPHRKKQAFKLCKLEGRSYEEAGQILGISSITVKEYVKTSAQSIRQSILSKQDYSTLATMTGLAVLVIFP